MSEKNYNELSKSDISRIAYEILAEGFVDESSESVERLEKLTEASEVFFYNLQLLHSGEGYSLEQTTKDAEGAIKDSLKCALEAIEGDDINEYLHDGLSIMKGLDRISQKLLGADVALFAGQEDDKIIKDSFNVIAQGVNDAKLGSNEAIFEQVKMSLEMTLYNWHNLTLSNVLASAQPNLNDKIIEKKQIRKDKIQKFARDAGAVALGSLPVIGALAYFNRKNK